MVPHLYTTMIRAVQINSSANLCNEQMISAIECVKNVETNEIAERDPEKTATRSQNCEEIA